MCSLNTENTYRITQNINITDLNKTDSLFQLWSIAFISRIVTYDETWIHHYKPESAKNGNMLDLQKWNNSKCTLLQTKCCSLPLGHERFYHYLGSQCTVSTVSISWSYWKKIWNCLFALNDNRLLSTSATLLLILQ